MVTRIGMAPRAAGMSYEDLQAHWRSSHADVAGGLPGLRAYVQLHAVLAEGRPLLPYAGFDACSELDFDDAAAMDAAFASEHYRTAVMADERAMIDRTRGGFALTRRRVLAGTTDGAGALLVTFLRVHPRSTLERLDATLGGAYRDAVAGAGAVGHAQLIAVPEAHAGGPPPVYDAIDQLAFASAEDACAYLRGEVAQRAAWELSGIGQGGDRLIAAPVPVVARA